MDNSKEFQLMLDEAIKSEPLALSEPLAFADFDRTKNAQDQLQEMVGFQPFSRESSVVSMETLVYFANWGYGHSLFIKQPGEIFNSMEQLLLAFVMKKKRNKTWNEEGWVG